MSATTTPTSSANGPNRMRRLLLTGLATIIALATIGYTAYYLAHGRWFENTDDAYANGNIVEVTPLMSGAVVEIGAADNTLVKAGQALVKLDPNDSRVALDQAEASLARTVRQVRGLYTNVEGQSADLAARQVALERAKEDVERRRGLDTNGAIAKEELAHFHAALDAAERAVAVSREQLSGTRALTDDTSVATHPEVKAASAVRKAYLDFSRSTLQAPVTGYVTQRSVQLGQHVAIGMPLMALVPLWLQTQLGYTSFWSGLATAPLGIFPIMLAPLIGKYSNHFDLRALATFALLIFGGIFYLRGAFNLDIDFAHVAYLQLLQGVGIALFFDHPALRFIRQ